MRKVQLTIKQEEVAPATTSDLVVMNNGKTLKEELSTNVLDKFSREVTVNNSMSKIIDGTLDGVYESCVFKGKSLVNLFDKSEIATNHASYTVGTDNTISFVANNGFTNGVDLSHLKPNTKYALFFDVLAVSQEPNIPYRINDDGTNYNINIFGHGQDNPTSGFHSFTTGSDVSDLKFFFYTNLRNVGFKLTLPVIIEYQEGMENWDIPYFDGLCDVKMPILRNVGKNLLDPQTFIPLDKEVEYVRYENGYVLANFTNANTHFFYKVDLARLPKGMYTVIAKHEGERSYLGIQHTFKDGTKTWGKTQFNNDGSYAELGLYMQSTTSDPSLKVKAKIMLVANGDTTSPYEDHKSNILHAPETVTLRSLPNGVRDELNVMTGEYIKRIGQITLNGTENDWITIFNFNGTEDYSTFKLDTALPNGRTVTYPLDAYIVDKMQNVCVLSEPREFVHINAQPMVCIKLLRTKLSEQTVAGLKAWLHANPITIQYELAEPMTTIVEPLTIPFAYENGHIILESGFEGQSLLPELKYSAPASKNGVISTTSNTILKHEQRLHKFEDLLLRESLLMDYRLTLSFLDKM